MKKYILIKCKNNIPFSLTLFKTRFRALSQMKSDFYKEIKSHNIDFCDKMHCGIEINDGSAWITTPNDARGRSRSYDWRIMAFNQNKINNYVLIKSFERNVSVIGFYKSNDEAKIAMAKDFENEIIYSAQDSVKVIENKLQNSSLKSEPIFHQEQDVINFDDGFARTSSNIGNCFWEIIAL